MRYRWRTRTQRRCSSAQGFIELDNKQQSNKNLVEKLKVKKKILCKPKKGLFCLESFDVAVDFPLGDLCAV
jgi:hypothetical protein